MPTATFRIWRGTAQGGKLEDYTTEVSEGMVVLDAVQQKKTTSDIGGTMGTREAGEWVAEKVANR